MKRAGLMLVFMCACAVLPGCDWESPPDCNTDDDCPYPEECIDNHCIDNSCPGGCPGGEYCQYGYCSPCTSDWHCGLGCINCADQGTNTACVYHDHVNQYQCGCYGDYHCGSGCCYLMSCTACI